MLYQISNGAVAFGDDVILHSIDFEIQKETLSKNKSLINLDNIKNQYIKKYSNTILELRKNGMGSQSIVKYLFENHRVKVSRGTIEKFYKQNNL
jgi:hypothetical protein